MQHSSLTPSERMAKLVSRLTDFDVDVLLLLDMKNIRYLTGFTGSDGGLVVGKGRKVLMVDGRYINQAKREAGDVEIFEYRDKMDAIEEVLSYGGSVTVGFESAAMSVDTFCKLKEKLKGVELRGLSDGISTIRAIKDEGEIECIKKAAYISFQALAAVKDLIKPGVREKDIALELEFQMGKHGAEGASFPTIVASGVNSALPHAAPGARRLEEGDIVLMDFGAVYSGYRSDETWTFAVGRADEDQRRAYALVKDAHDRALEAVGAGVACKEIDRVARSCIENGNMGTYFTHGTGHGVGLDVHETPRIGIKSESILEAGMVVTIEPGVYIPDLWGIRVEDTVLVKESGYEILTNVSKEFMILNQS